MRITAHIIAGLLLATSLASCGDDDSGGGPPDPPASPDAATTPPSPTPTPPTPTPPVPGDTGTPIPPAPPPPEDGGAPPTPPPPAPPPPEDAGAPPPPATAGSDPRPGYVGCGDTSCMTPDICCVGLGGAMCGGSTSCSGPLSATGTCDGPEDCSGGQACCVHFAMFGSEPNGAFCRTGGCPSGDQQLCQRDTECPSGQRCIGCMPPTGGFLDVTYGLCSAGTCPSPYTPAP